MKKGQQLLGYSLTECRDMFDLSPEDLSLGILGFGAKIETLNAGAIQQSTHADIVPYANDVFHLAVTIYDPALERDSSLNEKIAQFKALARVAKEVRIFMLIDPEEVKLLGALLLALQQENYGAELKQSHAKTTRPNAILRIWAAQCQLQP